MIRRDDSPLRPLGRAVLLPVTGGGGQINAEVDSLPAWPPRPGRMSILRGRAGQLKRLETLGHG